jgi:hypothetical protein
MVSVPYFPLMVVVLLKLNPFTLETIKLPAPKSGSESLSRTLPFTPSVASAMLSSVTLLKSSTTVGASSSPCTKKVIVVVSDASPSLIV